MDEKFLYQLIGRTVAQNEFLATQLQCANKRLQEQEKELTALKTRVEELTLTSADLPFVEEP